MRPRGLFLRRMTEAKFAPKGQLIRIRRSRRLHLVRHPLSCLACSAVSDEFERGWRGFLTDGESEPPEVAILCPACSERKFGDSLRLRRHQDDE